VNRLECQTCPYQYIIKKRFFERKPFARKEREDVFGGPGAWDNADKAQMQCPKEGCNGEEAAFFQVQIRSADEPMTGFYKVRLYDRFRRVWMLMNAVYDMWKSVERELRASKWDWVNHGSEERLGRVLCFV
jgi:DNA-directed RNA polymerase subunit M/transcription elongation factor TFIIS